MLEPAMSGPNLVRTTAPLYRDISTALERALREGVWRAGDKIPSEAELEKQFGASRGTLRLAISELVRKGLLHRQAGRGTFVLGPEFRTLTRFFLYGREGDEATIIPTPKLLERRTIRADEGVAKALKLQVGAEVGYVHRLRYHDDEPFQTIESYFHPDTWAQVSDADFATYPLYDLFKDAFGLYIIRADEFLRADLASPAEAELLEVAAGSPIMRLQRIAYTFEDQPAEYRRAAGRSDKLHYHVRLK